MSNNIKPFSQAPSRAQLRAIATSNAKQYCAAIDVGENYKTVAIDQKEELASLCRKLSASEFEGVSQIYHEEFMAAVEFENEKIDLRLQELRAELAETKANFEPEEAFTEHYAAVRDDRVDAWNNDPERIGEIIGFFILMAVGGLVFAYFSSF